MEKKNTILLTVIAIATLLVAVVGATFAYFTATLTPANEGNNTVEVTTRTMVAVTYNEGAKLTATDVLPGYKGVKSVTITGDSVKTSQPVNGKFTVTPTIPEAFGEDVTWTLYKSKTGVTCADPVINIADGQYSETVNCTIPSDKEVIISGSTEAVTSKDISVAYDTNDNYYLVVEYANNGDQTENQAGQSFSAEITFALS
jgi:predicted ribosomally synthesized peptide with SipW-like signal peptide